MRTTHGAGDVRGAEPPRTARRRALTALCAVAVLLTGLLTSVARGAPATALDYPAGAAGSWFNGRAFDVCDTPSRTSMRAWKNSPYRALGIYISGPLRACGQKHLTADWVTDVTRMGWKLLPLDVGLQAPCRTATRLRAMSRDPGQAARQGISAAERALAASKRLGILPGSIVYSDLEPYHAARDPRCAEAVRSYVAGWTRELHRAGYLAGVYASQSYGAISLANSYADAGHARVDAIWNARWNNRANTRGWAGIAETKWSTHQRVKQYRGDHYETHGGVRLNVDSNIVDGPVATVALPYPVTTDLTDLTLRDRPHVLGAAKGVVAAGSSVRVVCQTRTTLGIWDKLANGTYLPDAVVAGGSAKPQLPGCTMPFQVAGGASMRSGPGVEHAVRGTTYDGSLAWVVCETPGITLGRPGYWQRIVGGLWVSGALVARPDPGKRTTGVPLCTA